LVSPQEDLEGGAVKYEAGTPTGSNYDETAAREPLTSLDTPFFHIDLIAAVRAAEGGASEISKKK
jgi:hypothetical protein